MNPKIINVQEGRAIAPGGTVQTVLNVQYTVGSYGPFTLVTNWADLNSGKALQQMKAAAATLGQLPVT